MVMLPNGEQGMVVSESEYSELVAGGGGGGGGGEAKQQPVYMVTQDPPQQQQQPAVVASVNGFTAMQKPKVVDSSHSMIKIVGIQDKKPTSHIAISRPLKTKTSYTTFQPDNNKQQIRAPRKQSLPYNKVSVVFIGSGVRCLQF